MWKKCLDCIDELLDILFENNNIFIGENIAEDSESLAVSDQVSHPVFLADVLFLAFGEGGLFLGGSLKLN